jgi:hypothetical protein
MISIVLKGASLEDTFKIANNLNTFNERLTFLLQETIRKKLELLLNDQ